MVYRSLFISLLFFINISHALSDNLWSDISPDNVAQARSSHSKLSLLPDKYRLQHLNEAEMRAELEASSNSSARKSAGNKTTDLKVPLPNGKFLSLKVIANSTMAPELAAKYPQIKTYKVEGKDNNGIYGAIDFTEQGFHAMLFMHDGSRLFIDPRKIANKKVYIVYYDKHYHPPGKKPFKCNIESHNHPEQQLGSISYRIAHLYKSAQRSANQIKIYRLAMATTGEYTAYHGGTVVGALSAITTTVSRVNEIYQRDLAIKFELVAKNNLLISTDTTIYSNDNGDAMLAENQTEIDRLIGTAKYDIGHVMGTVDDSKAYLGSVCDNAYKAGGVTGRPQPFNDAFDIDYVAHEIGHQFGGNHSFNICDGDEGRARNAETAFEPGSGSTIMAYAGICGDNNIQRHSDAMFHIKSIEEITNFVDNSACGTASPIQNHKPTVNAGSDYTIPAKTAFELTGSGNDSDGDSLTYSWEQTDIGDASDFATDTGNNTLFRSFLPQATSSRVFPILNSIINNTQSKGEILPTTTRKLNFSLAVRDGKGGIASDDMLISVNGTNPFRITSHNTAGTISGSTTVTWDIANTNTAPISCGEVNILLSKDAGLTFTNVSRGATANDGSESITLPPNATESTTTRFKVKCADNVFFDISDENQTIQTPVRIQSTILSNVGSNLVADPGETIHITVPLQNNDTLIATNINGSLSSSTQGITVVAAESQYPIIQPSSQSENTTSFLVNVPTNHVCGTDLSFSMDTNYTLGATQTNNIFNFIVPVGIPIPKSQTNSNRQAIPDGSSTTSQITLTGLEAVLRPALNVDIDITHTFIGDLDIKLTSPQGTTVQLKQSNLNGSNSANLKGNYPSTIAPLQDLSTFNGENLDGVWTLTVSDEFADDSGTLNRWSLNYDSFNCEVFTNTDTDTDNDGVTDNIDNCPFHSNPRQGELCTPYQLKNNQWHQISIPATDNNTTVADIFADDFLNAEYNEKWVLYSYDGNAYSKLELFDFVEQGKGYWIIQITGSAVDIDLPVNVLETSIQQSSQCASTSGCYEVILQTVANNGHWSMIGYPFEISLNSTEDIRVVTNSGVCGDADGCTLDEAFTAKVFLNNLWSYNGEAYVDLLTTSNIASWTGMWGRTLENSNGLEVRILFPLL